MGPAAALPPPAPAGAPGRARGTGISTLRPYPRPRLRRRFRPRCRPRPRRRLRPGRRRQRVQGGTGLTALRPPCDEGVVVGVPVAGAPVEAAVAAGASASRGAWVLAATILGSSMAFVDGTAVNVALPALQRDLGATVSDVQWVVEGYALM